MTQGELSMSPYIPKRAPCLLIPSRSNYMSRRAQGVPAVVVPADFAVESQLCTTGCPATRRPPQQAEHEGSRCSCSAHTMQTRQEELLTGPFEPTSDTVANRRSLAPDQTSLQRTLGCETCLRSTMLRLPPLVVLVLGLAAGASGLYEASGPVPLLTQRSFSKVLDRQLPVVVEFFAPW